ncbi:bifunctional 3-phenylpropionate/cinnamic acid dioxygenase ferredoxin subunit [Nocardia fluminea]|uniref:bifunctional 3-phenylpropionate/cinnamic acid dioxygenase ferredoxin subunit n=1 Tax=Nocardia fluminea TaxID=134984 RepID=UPI0033E97BBF
MPWITACSINDVPDDGDSFRADLIPPIAIFNSDGEYFATADTCTHAAFALSDGYVENRTVECPVHLATFCLRTGKPLKMPATEPLATFEVRVEGDSILIEIP